MKKLKISWDEDFEGGGFKYGIPSLQSPNIIPYINSGNILDFCSGVGTLGFYLYTSVECLNLTLVDKNPSVEKHINHTIKDNGLTNVEFISSDGMSNFSPDIKFDTVVLNPPHFKGSFSFPSQLGKTHTSKEARISFDSKDLRFHNDFYKNIYKYLKPTSSIIHIGCYTGRNAITPNDIINIIKDTYNIHFIEYNSITTDILQMEDGKVLKSKFYTMVLKPNPNL